MESSLLFKDSFVIPDNFGFRNIWTSSDTGLDTYSFGWIISDQDIWLQLNNTIGVSPDEQFTALFIPANTMAFIPPLMGSSPTPILQGSQLIQGTNFDIVDILTVQRDSVDNTGDATISFALFK